MIYKSIIQAVGKTPIIKIPDKRIDLYAKIEWYNPMGSIKDRAAIYIIKKLLADKEINSETTIIESSSGNYGVALAAACNFYNLSFICVVDPLISSINELIIRELGATVIKVQEIDANGGYLLTRIAKVQELLEVSSNMYWMNQYENPYTVEAYVNTIGKELCEEFERIDFIFIGVSSGGTITGISKTLKDHFPKIKIIAVDVEGSVIFGGNAAKRSIPGIGAGRRPPILDEALIDYVQIVSEKQTINMCKTLLREQCLFAGGSSGSVYAAIQEFFKDKREIDQERPVVVAIFPDSGNRYEYTIYK